MKLDLRLWLGLDPTRNSFLKLSEADRHKLVLRVLLGLLFAAVVLWAFGRITKWR
jgi:hypothetical protein